MNGPQIAMVVHILVAEHMKGHDDHLDNMVRTLVLGDPHGAVQVTSTLALLSRRGVTRHPGEDFHRLEVYVFDDDTGRLRRAPLEDLEPPARIVLQMGVAAHNREWSVATALWNGYVDGSPQRAIELLMTAVVDYGRTAVVAASPSEIEDQT